MVSPPVLPAMMGAALSLNYTRFRLSGTARRARDAHATRTRRAHGALARRASVLTITQPTGAALPLGYAAGTPSASALVQCGQREAAASMLILQ